MLDISGPSSLIVDGSAGYYTYGVARIAGEVLPGSAQGDVYANCPYVNTPNADSISSEDPYSVAPMVGNFPPEGTAITQFVITSGSTTGANSRILARQTGVQQMGLQPFITAKVSPDNSWIAFPNWFLNGNRPWVMMARIGTLPIPVSDGVNRNDFTSITVTDPAAGAAPASTTNAVAQCGYLENGTASQHYCTSRQEACIQATAGTLFGFVTTDKATYSGTACSPGATNCSATFSGLPGHMAYCTLSYRDSSGNILGSGQPFIKAVAPLPPSIPAIPSVRGGISR
jgi:hypothetical protein